MTALEPHKSDLIRNAYFVAKLVLFVSEGAPVSLLDAAFESPGNYQTAIVSRSLVPR
jgi:hypothetical protein